MFTSVFQSANPGHELNVALARKIRYSAVACQKPGLAFIPLAAESLGGWHEVAIAEVCKWGKLWQETPSRRRGRW